MKTLLKLALLCVALMVPALSFATPISSGKPLKTPRGAINRILRTEYPGVKFNRPTLSTSGIANTQKWSALAKVTGPTQMPVNATGLLRNVVGGYIATGAEPLPNQ